MTNPTAWIDPAAFDIVRAAAQELPIGTVITVNGTGSALVVGHSAFTATSYVLHILAEDGEERHDYPVRRREHNLLVKAHVTDSGPRVFPPGSPEPADAAYVEDWRGFIWRRGVRVNDRQHNWFRTDLKAMARPVLWTELNRGKPLTETSAP